MKVEIIFSVSIIVIVFANVINCATTTPNPDFPEKNNGSQRTPLDDFVFSEESLSQFYWNRVDQYDYSDTSLITGIGYKVYVLNMTSGQWLTGILQKIMS